MYPMKHTQRLKWSCKNNGLLDELSCLELFSFLTQRSLIVLIAYNFQTELYTLQIRISIRLNKEPADLHKQICKVILMRVQQDKSGLKQLSLVTNILPLNKENV